MTDESAACLRAHALTWAEEGQLWEHQGSQVAAESIAWGLMDEP